MYIIVQFLETEEVGIVPDTWMLGTLGCMWPKDTDPAEAEKMIKNKTPPETNWTQWRVKVLKKFVTYNQARLKLKDAEETSDLSDTPKSSRKRNPPSRFSPSGASKRRLSSESESESQYSQDDGRTAASSRSSSHSANFSPPTLDCPPFFTLNEASGTVTPETPQIVFHDHKFTQTDTEQCDSGTAINLGNGNRNSNSEFEKLVLSTLALIKRDVDNIATLVSTNVLKTNQQEHVTNVSLPALPATNPEALEAFELTLASPEEKEKLVKHLVSKGGKNISEGTSRIMTAVLTDDCGAKYSLLGRRGKYSFKRLQNIMDSILAAHCKIIPSLVTVCKSEEEVGNWLVNAGDRVKKRENRAQKNVASDFDASGNAYGVDGANDELSGASDL